MRFFLGLCLGALLVFVAAIGFKQPGKLLTTVEHQAAKPAVRPHTTSSTPDNAVLPVSTIKPLHLIDVDERQIALQSPEVAIPPQLEQMEQHAPETQPESTETLGADEALESRGTQPISALPEPAEIANDSHAGRQTSQPAQLASVWAPFHSEASATGFARRLKAELDKDFTVHKAGPANYHVVFAYDNELERSSILGQIAHVTGQVKGTLQQ